MSYKRLEFTAAWFFIKHCLQEKKSWNRSDFCPWCKCLFPEIGTAHKDWWTMLKFVDTEMSPVPSQAVIMNGTIYLLSSLPLPSRPLQPLVFRGALWQSVWWRRPWGGGLVLLNQNAIASLKTFHPTTAEGLPGPHLQQVDGARFPWSLSESGGQARHSIIKSSGHETSTSAICHTHMAVPQMAVRNYPSKGLSEKAKVSTEWT